MLNKLTYVARRSADVVRNPYLSSVGKLECLVEKPWLWSRVRLRGGWGIELATDEDRCTFNDVFFDESYADLPYAGATVIDVGGHKGYFALYALMRGARKVYVVECEPANVTAVERLIHSNRVVDRVTLVPKAAWSAEGPLQLEVSDENWAHSVVRGGAGTRTITVEATTLGHILSGETDGAPVIVKSNCEGAETEVFRNVPACVTDMIISYHAWAPQTLQDFLADLEAQGFGAQVMWENDEHTNLRCRRIV